MTPLQVLRCDVKFLLLSPTVRQDIHWKKLNVLQCGDAGEDLNVVHHDALIQRMVCRDVNVGKADRLVGGLTVGEGGGLDGNGLRVAAGIG